MKYGWTGKAGGDSGGALGILNKFLKQSAEKQSWGSNSLGDQKKIVPKDTSGGELGQFSGTITKAGPKFGFIECPEVSAIGGKSQVFILADELKQFEVGRRVKFTAYFDGQGRLQGKDLKGQWIPELSTQGKKGGNTMGLPKALVDLLMPGGGDHSLGSPKAFVPKDTSGGELGQFSGTISKGGAKFGFLQSPDLESIGQSSNVFILGDELRDFQVGQDVMFTAYLDGQGRLQGKDLQAQGEPAGGAGTMGLPKALVDLMMTAGGGSSLGLPKAIVAKDTSGGEFGELLGTITKTGAKFGFLEAPDLESMGQSTNVFILGDELGQYGVGDQVMFTAYLDGKGRLQGKDLKSIFA